MERNHRTFRRQKETLRLLKFQGGRVPTLSHSRPFLRTLRCTTLIFSRPLDSVVTFEFSYLKLISKIPMSWLPECPCACNPVISRVLLISLMSCTPSGNPADVTNLFSVWTSLLITSYTLKLHSCHVDVITNFWNVFITAACQVSLRASRMPTRRVITLSLKFELAFRCVLPILY